MELSTHAFLVQLYETTNEPEKSIAHCLAIGRMTPYDPDQEYKPLFKIPPKYPQSALRNGHEGYAIVGFTVAADGTVNDPKVLETTGDKSFGEAALDAARKFRYAPRFVDGQPVATEGVRNQFTFQIIN